MKRKTADLKEYQRKYREEHKEEINRKAKEKAFIFNKMIGEYKKDKCCSICGYKEHPEILEFHHLKDKIKDISSLRGKVSLKKSEEELEKCVLLCPNCHRWLHWEEIKRSKEQYKE